MKINRQLQCLVAVATLAVSAMGVTGSAQAREQDHHNVFWSVGVSSPGVQVGFSNARPVVVQTPMYPVYQQPAPVYVQPTVYMRPAPMYVQPAPVYFQPVVSQPQFVQAGWGYPERHYGWRHGHRHHGHWSHDRQQGERGGRGGGDHHRR